MEITDIIIYPFEPGEPYKDLKAYAEVTLDDKLVIKGIQVFQKSNGGIYIRFPAVKGKGNEFKEVVIAKDPEFKKYVRDRVVELYKKELGQS